MDHEIKRLVYNRNIVDNRALVKTGAFWAVTSAVSHCAGHKKIYYRYHTYKYHADYISGIMEINVLPCVKDEICYSDSVYGWAADGYGLIP